MKCSDLFRSPVIRGREQRGVGGIEPIGGVVLIPLCPLWSQCFPAPYPVFKPMIFHSIRGIDNPQKMRGKHSHVSAP
jgi:hypothetical protein